MASIRFDHFGVDFIDIDTAAEQLPTRPCSWGVLLKAHSGNANSIFIGVDDTVTTTTGFELAAGDEVFLPLTNLDAVWAIAGAVNQNLMVLAF